jgi:hypothetical protein
VANQGLNLYGTILEGKSIGSDPEKKEFKGGAHDLENQDVC